MKDTYRYGLKAELKALLFLLGKGYFPIARRYKTPVGEIDLICRRGSSVIFVECKARRTLDEALEALRPQQIARIRQAATYFLAAKPSYNSMTLRFDLLAVARCGSIRHLDNVF